ncbi:MAG: GNAT family N-acetyltransferase [Micrococcales bacterium]|nr:GNAT family N-acetyltransferase [Micrococcales bacterium]
MSIVVRNSRPRLKLRVLRLSQLAAAIEFCRQAGPSGVLAGARILDRQSGRLPAGEVWAITAGPIRAGGIDEHRRVRALAWSGANLMPVGANTEQAQALARHAAGLGQRPCASIVGPAEAVMAMWQILRPGWGQARDIWSNQLLMEISGPPLVAADPRVRLARPDEADQVIPAAAAMFAEELGVPPPGPSGTYNAFVRQMVAHGAIYVRMAEGGQGVEFKADLGAVLGDIAQVQGVWTDPALRGKGLAKAGMAAVVAQTRARGTPRLSLYVNSFNIPAVAAYRRVGFEQVGTFATIMF